MRLGRVTQSSPMRVELNDDPGDAPAAGPALPVGTEVVVHPDVREGSRFVVWPQDQLLQHGGSKPSTATASRSAAPITEYPQGYGTTQVNNTDGSAWPGNGFCTVFTSRVSSGASTATRDFQMAVDTLGSVFVRRWNVSGAAWGPWRVAADDTGWVAITEFSAGWSPYQTAIGGSDWPPRCRRLNGTVHVEGLVNGSSGVTSGVACTLPAGFRPGTGVLMRGAIIAGGGHQRMNVHPDGRIVFGTEVAGALTTGWHSLACSFPQEA